MKVLLDTHTFIWWDSQPEQLSSDIVEFLTKPETEKFVSVISLWEIQIKSQLGKLTLNQPLENIYQSQSQNFISFLEVTPYHIFKVGVLPFHHKDPFDRMLIAQAMTEGLTILTRDKIFNLYGVPLLWI
ncbi:type II toxin-antitoxin system VapC family toxin [Laspinema olomoucense]|uniref:type II toxin-antitoxin system VapC family toxin n=1 Tax=Laspinema olomoucense TaxID=3231600 RepID=UPI0021BAAB3E|nr:MULTISPECIES: type II toxin-antitoxin system VapC family toxin [unclassified Laspinema]MCT7973348.1 type II toxin-antitoxin system VapC family toxin [Laspinema sp. D3d]MCT7989912.1 type II toxin-antitoxin system VapC family toxin [Laspinema sp. D3a]